MTSRANPKTPVAACGVLETTSCLWHLGQDLQLDVVQSPLGRRHLIFDALRGCFCLFTSLGRDSPERSTRTTNKMEDFRQASSAAFLCTLFGDLLRHLRGPAFFRSSIPLPEALFAVRTQRVAEVMCALYRTVRVLANTCTHCASAETISVLELALVWTFPAFHGCLFVIFARLLDWRQVINIAVFRESLLWGAASISFLIARLQGQPHEQRWHAHTHTKQKHETRDYAVVIAFWVCLLAVPTTDSASFMVVSAAPDLVSSACRL